MKEYVQQAVKQEKHIDGRRLTDYRSPIIIENNISKNAEGTARVKIGKTEVVVGIKMDVGEPYSDSPDEGTIIVTAELLPMSNPVFESGPPGIQAIEIARIVDRGIRESKYLDFKKLCVKKGEKIWMVLIDIYTINDDGNLIDAAALAAIAALKDSKIPAIKEDKADYGNLTNKKLPLDEKNLPITVTVNKIGDKLLVDADSREEEAVTSRVSIAVKSNGEISAIQKGGEEGLTQEEVEKMIDIAIKKREELAKLLK